MRKPTLAIGGTAASAGPRSVARAGLVAAALLGMAATSSPRRLTTPRGRPPWLPAPAGSAPAAPPVAAKAVEGAGGPTITGTIVLAPARKGDVSPNDAVARTSARGASRTTRRRAGPWSP